MDIRMSHIVIWPISLVSGSTVIYITSQVVSRDSIINVMLNLRNPHSNQLYFSSKVYSTQCPSCKANNFADCEHDVIMPTYFDRTRFAMVSALMKGYRDIYRREIRNEQVSDRFTKCFDMLQLNIMYRPENEYYSEIQHPEVYVMIDPSAGGTTSSFAIVSFITAPVTMPGTNESRMCLIVCIYYYSFTTKILLHFSLLHK